MTYLTTSLPYRSTGSGQSKTVLTVSLLAKKGLLTMYNSVKRKNRVQKSHASWLILRQLTWSK